MIKSFVPTKTINIDKDTALEISELPEEIQRIVELYDEWRIKELEAKSELARAQYALIPLGNELAEKVKNHLNPPTEETAESALDEVANDPEESVDETE